MPKIESVHSPCACAGASLCAFAASRWHAGTLLRSYSLLPRLDTSMGEDGGGGGGMGEKKG